MARNNPPPTSASRPARTRTIIIAVAIGLVMLLGAGIWIWASTSSSEAAAPAGVLHQDTRMGAVDLTVSDLPLMRDYYEDAVGLEVVTETEDRVELGSDDTVLISLTRGADLEPAADPTTAGLYHTAILYPDEASLAAVLLSVAETAPNTYQGSADHSVSLAFYFADPEGNGVELYVDTPEETWEWNDGRVTMGAAPLDPNQFISENLAQRGSGSATVGHMHLRVGDLDAAQEFYADALGFDITAEVPGALFLSAGGYHHHLAVNTWSSQNAPERIPALGLGHFTVLLANAAELDAASVRIADAGLVATPIDGGIAVDDPWGNTVHLRVA